VLRTLALAVVTAALPPAFAQQKRADNPGFEVASIKPSDPNPESPMFIGMTADGAIVKYTNITLRDCIKGAYRVRDFQIVGPDWMTRSRFEISATLPAGASMDQIPEMLQSLLEERFKLEIRREQKETNVYALLVGNGGPKLKPAEVKSDAGAPTALGPDGKPRAMMTYGFPPGGVFVKAQSATIESIVGLVSRFTARPVIDLTGIQGQYEFDLSFSPDGNIDLPGVMAVGPDGKPMQPEPLPSLFDAVRKYGLRLEARKAPIEMLIVTHLEKAPTEN
jgi:uncharacterized protein (TIGR03435 family)